MMLVSQHSEHNRVCQCNLCLTSLTNRMCPSLTVALPDLPENEHGTIVEAQLPQQQPVFLAGGRQRNEISYRQNDLCAFVAKCMNEYANQHGTGVDFYTMSAHILQSVKL